MSSNDLDQIARLFRLREAGVLTAAEFEAEKARILYKSDMSDAANGAVPEPDTILGDQSVASAALDEHADQSQFEAEHAEALPHRSRTLTVLILAALLAIVTGLGWYLMLGRPPTVEGRAVSTLVDSSPTPSPARTVEAKAPAELNGISLYRWATSIETLGVTPDYLIGKLGEPRRRDDTSLDFLIASCDIRYEAQGSSISSFDAEVSPSCKPTLAGLNAASDVNVAQATTLADIERKAGGVFIADCLERCGTAADPAQYLFIQGPHADNFINIAVMADPQATKGTEKWAAAIKAAHNLTDFDEVPEEGHRCGTEAQDIALQEVGLTRIGRVLVGQGVTTKSLTSCEVLPE